MITWGDSHAGHLHPGLQHLQKERAFRLMMLPWGCPLTPTATEERCRIPSESSMDELRAICHAALAVLGLFTAYTDGLPVRYPQKIAPLLAASSYGDDFAPTPRSLKPDIVILSAFWPQYRNRLASIGTALAFVRTIRAPRRIVVGPAPLWYGSAQDPAHQVPDRLPEYQAKFFAQDSEHAETMDSVEAEVSEIAKRFGATFVSPRAILCNEHGCLVRIGDMAKGILQVDNSHFGDAGSWFLVHKIARNVFGS